jgi:hypothetical protein
MIGSRPNTPLLQNSISFARFASETFLSSLQSEFFSSLLGLTPRLVPLK